MSLNPTSRDFLDRANDWQANREQLGRLIHETPKVVKGNWNFTRDGGAIGVHTLKDQDGVSPLVIPAGALVLSAVVHVNAALTSGGAITVVSTLESAGDVLASTLKAALGTGVLLQGVPVFSDLTKTVVTTVDRNPALTFGVAAATAGSIDVFVWFVF